MIRHARHHRLGYEVSSKGDARFSALHAVMPDGRTVEMWYQCDVKGYDIGGRNWRLGKGKLALGPLTTDQLYELYLGIWRLWAIRNIALMSELSASARSHGSLLKDCFASSPINQARALAQIINEWGL